MGKRTMKPNEKRSNSATMKMKPREMRTPNSKRTAIPTMRG